MSGTDTLKELRAENARLIALLEAHGIEWRPPVQVAHAEPRESEPSAAQLGIQDKLNLFRRLFKGRTDVFPLRWESKAGKSGYSPACANEWRVGICEKPRIKCADCPNRRFLPVTDEVIRWHLSGQDDDSQPFVAGVYPLLRMSPASSLPSTSTRAAGRRMLRRSSTRAVGSMCPPNSNGLGQDEAGTCGSSSRTPFLLRWPAGLARIS